MEQQQLREWEQKCIQEEPPECTASCPLHVDARLFVKQMGKGDPEAAFKVLAKSMPFPGILGRICDHPCEIHCKRGAVEAPIAIGRLERYCVESSTLRARVQLLPRRAQRIAILGSGLAGLTAAWDLLKKGFQVSIFEPGEQLGGKLRLLPAELLPPEILHEELATLENLKGEFRCGEPLDAARFEALCREFDALFIDRETLADIDLPLARNAAGEILVDPATGATDRSGVFAGGDNAGQGNYSPVTETLQGRKGSLSIERFIQKAQMGAGRGNDGPFQTRLYTDVAGIESAPRVEPADLQCGYNSEEALQEAARCLQCECMECVKACLYLERYQGYPKKYARQVFNNERIIYGAGHTKNQFVNSCSNCGLCETVCPNDFHMGDLCLQARRTMLEQKLMPAAFHEFALQDMAHSRGADFAHSCHQPDRKTSDWAYFPSCQLCATTPVEVLTSYQFLQDKLPGGVGIILGCCGAQAYWSGRDALFREALGSVRQNWLDLGKPLVITACATCQALFKEHLPELSTVSLWQVLEETGLPSGYLTGSAGTIVTLVDPCITRDDPEIQKSVRRMIESLGLSLDDPRATHEKPECCGYGGLMFNANPQLARDLIEHRAKGGEPAVSAPPVKPIPASNGWYRSQLLPASDTAYYQTQVSEHDYLAYCAMCRDNFAGAGKRVSHLIEHLFPATPDLDPAARGWISWSERRANRAGVKMEIRRQQGETCLESNEPAHSLQMSEEVRKRIDARRILTEDLMATIGHAEQSGKRLVQQETGWFRACHKSGNVTFWVDYQKLADGYIVHNAYSHRMQIQGVM